MYNKPDKTKHTQRIKCKLIYDDMFISVTEHADISEKKKKQYHALTLVTQCTPWSIQNVALYYCHIFANY